MDEDGRVIAGRYRLLGPLGRGGMGIVWRARDEVLGREVAVKEVRAPAGLDPAEVERMYRRLEREAWAAARVSHRGVVTVYDVATEGGRPWIVMELVRGLSLADVLEGEGPMTPQRAAHIGEQVLAALRSAHESGVVHRDVKPANVLIANDGRVLLGDFGIASLEGSSAITRTGEVVGSPEFLAPERALGREPGPASDLWSLGVLLYAAVEGASPFRRDTPLATLRAVVEGEPPPPRRAGPLAPVLEGLLRKDPDERLPAAEAARMLRVIGAGGTVRAPQGAGGTVRAPAGPASGPQAPTTPLPERNPSGQAPTTPLATPLATRVAAAESGRRRAGLVLAAGVVVLLLAVVALGWLLFDERGRPDGSNGSTGSGGSGGSGPTGSAPASASPPPAPSDSPPASGSPTPGRQVTLYVHTLYGSYRGTCPPPPAGAPAFTGTIAVDAVPAVVEYRWVTRGGTAAPDAGWQSVTYEAGGAKTRQFHHTEPGTGGSFDDAVRLEVRMPARAVSAWMDFSVTCEEETPTAGASSSAPPAPSGSPGPTPDPGETP
ncbi:MULTISPECIES: serine/threonine-protein kinase [unclassified Streptomyces]|uniref:serine/threonine-protein kinase n=1 Tax=unclassified Streptomyces TaxID=2593676 RepID=UPI002E333713|nr:MULTISPECIES: serine/threonine-protein kinase [unclassified Streptomyces]WUC67132.1 serine/threonine protein kinase [Streptomyces sp. NBC_00539]